MTLDLDAPTLELAVIEAPARCLYRCDDGEVFAYAQRGNEFVRVSDHQVWAHEHDDQLVSARSGEALAYRRGDFYYELGTGLGLYFMR
jgi:hypothetical protein